MFLKEFSATQLQRDFPKIAKSAYRQPIRITRQGKKGLVVMSEAEYLKLKSNG